jgi:hypothetical protein
LPHKIPLHVIVQKIQNRQITETDARKIFTVAPNPAKPFDFNIRFNADAVDVSNAPSASLLAGPLHAILASDCSSTDFHAFLNHPRSFPENCH